MREVLKRILTTKTMGVAFLALALISLFIWNDQYLNLHHVLKWQEHMKSWFEESPVGFAFIYFLVFTGVTALCLPGASLMMLACGGCMNFWLCCLLSTGGFAVGALITMMAARYAFRTKIENKHGQRLEQIEKGLNRHAVSYLLSLRLAPIIPFVLLNLLAGLTHIKARTFFWTSFVGMLPGTALYVYAGSQAGQAKNFEDLLSLELFLSIAALAILPWIFNWLFSPIRRAEQT